MTEEALELLKAEFYALVAPGIPNEWDVEEALEPLLGRDREEIDAVFAQVPAVWGVSHSLCFSFLALAAPVLKSLEEDERSLWVHALLDRYEAEGLQTARTFLQQTEQQFVQPLRGEGSLRLAAVRSLLQPYVNGLLNREIPLHGADSPGTDGQSLFLPREIDLFADHRENFLLYKLMASFHCASLLIGTFDPPAHLPPRKKAAHPLERFFATFDHAETARDLYHFFETARILSWLRRELPGLMREFAPLLPLLALPPDHDDTDSQKQKTPGLIDRLQGLLLRGEKMSPDKAIDVLAEQLLGQVREESADNSASIRAVQELMPLLSEEPASYPLVFQGHLRLHEMQNVQMKDLTNKELRLMSSMFAGLKQGATRKQGEEGKGSKASALQGQSALVTACRELIKQQQAELPENLRIDHPELKNVSDEEGHMAKNAATPSGTGPASTAGRAGQGSAVFSPCVPEEGAESNAPFVYDEWDYRRKGFRKKWCVLTEKPLAPVKNALVAETLTRYKGQIRRLQRQFEQMRSGERFVRRQREGSDIDLDAVLESLADLRAGYAPSERLFIRLVRDYRDIATFFLVDMSNSTAGWIGKAIKESLVLLCEAMEKLKDRYAVYGFSGMRRLRCEVYPVKKMTEPYSAKVQNRIAAIGPKEYTRMAPAIRHLSSLAAGVEARIRLLIVLTDGKPEDYDDYKGNYAIEDTRHALLEAQMQGIHTFGITIDREAHDYMEHMFGAHNFLFIDEVNKLPSRMPVIYRNLTS